MVEKLTQFTFALAGLVAFAFLLLGAAPAVAQSAPIGEVRELTGTVTIDRGSQTGITVALGDQVFQNDVVETGANSGIGVTFVDGTNFGLGADARMILDEFAYNPSGNSGAGVLRVVEGSFAFISGGLTKVGDDAFTIETPTMTIGIRGTTGSGRGGPEGTLNYVILERDEDGGVGKIYASNDGGSQLLTRANQRTETASRARAPRAPFFVTQDEINQETGQAIDHLPGKSDRTKDKPQNTGAQQSNSGQSSGQGAPQRGPQARGQRMDRQIDRHRDHNMARHRDQHIERAGEDGVFRAADRQN